MAAPTAPTFNSLITEALSKAGGANYATATRINRAKRDWMEEIKNDIWRASRGKLRSLRNTAIIGMTTDATLANTPNEGKAIQDNPTDLAEHMSMQLIQGIHYGECQAGGSTTTAVLAASEDMSESWAIGREIILFITKTQTTSYSSYIVDFDESTKVATFSPEITASAGTTYTYIIADSYKPVQLRPIMRYDEAWTYSSHRGEPQYYSPLSRYTDDDNGLGANDSGQFLFYPSPYFNSDSIPRAFKLNYYVNLLKVDTTEGSGRIITTLLTNWRTEFDQGLFSKALKALDDVRAADEGAKYQQMLRNLSSVETTGGNLSTLQATVNKDEGGLWFN